MTRSANYVVTQYCKEEGHLALTINNKGCNRTCMRHTILPLSCLLMLCVSGPLICHPVPSSPELARPERDPEPGTCPWEELLGTRLELAAVTGVGSHGLPSPL